MGYEGERESGKGYSKATSLSPPAIKVYQRTNSQQHLASCEHFGKSAASNTQQQHDTQEDLGQGVQNSGYGVDGVGKMGRASIGGERRGIPPRKDSKGNGVAGGRLGGVTDAATGRGQAVGGRVREVGKDEVRGRKGGGRLSHPSDAAAPKLVQGLAPGGNRVGLGRRTGGRGVKAGSEEDFFDKHEPTIISASSRLIFYTGPATAAPPTQSSASSN